MAGFKNKQTNKHDDGYFDVPEMSVIEFVLSLLPSCASCPPNPG